ncbi:MAG TPA: disulfide bond formation protein B [Rubrivivax sp.]|nr:disulfide bond formation protein B [Rubrivivax sp.]
MTAGPVNSEQQIKTDGVGRDSAAWTPLFLAWLLALLATAGALFLGEVMGKTPCVLCWYQRIAMFPLVTVLGAGLLASDVRSVRYALPLAGAGWAIAAWHLLVFWGVFAEGLVPCGKGTSCADADVQVAGVVPIPLLSLLAFTGILALLWVARGRAKA